MLVNSGTFIPPRERITQWNWAETKIGPKAADGAPSLRGEGWGEGELVSRRFHASGPLRFWLRDEGAPLNLPSSFPVPPEKMKRDLTYS